jgi:hypothetical protein
MPDVIVAGGTGKGNPALQYNDLLGWTFDPGGQTNQTALSTAATLYLGRIPLPATTTITNVLAFVQVPGLTLTHSFLALFTSTGAIIGQSIDQSTAWGNLGSAGLYTLPLVGGPHVCAPLAGNDFLYAGIYCGTFVTAPTVMGAFGYLQSITPAPRMRGGYVGQADTATLTNINPANMVNFINFLPWLAIS